MKPLKPEQTNQVGGAAQLDAIDADWPPYQIEPHLPEQPVAQPIPGELSPDNEMR